MDSDKKYDELIKYSNPQKVRCNLDKYLGKNTQLYISTHKTKKYMVLSPNGFIHFGQYAPPMEDYTKHQNEIRRIRYLQRATAIKGNWLENPYSANNLSIHLLWT
jgi:hypothetical protein